MLELFINTEIWKATILKEAIKNVRIMDLHLFNQLLVIE